MTGNICINRAMTWPWEQGHSSKTEDHTNSPLAELVRKVERKLCKKWDLFLINCSVQIRKKTAWGIHPYAKMRARVNTRWYTLFILLYFCSFVFLTLITISPILFCFFKYGIVLPLYDPLGFIAPPRSLLPKFLYPQPLPIPTVKTYKLPIPCSALPRISQSNGRCLLSFFLVTRSVTFQSSVPFQWSERWPFPAVQIGDRSPPSQRWPFLLTHHSDRSGDHFPLYG